MMSLIGFGPEFDICWKLKEGSNRANFKVRKDEMIEHLLLRGKYLCMASYSSNHESLMLILIGIVKLPGFNDTSPYDADKWVLSW